jgi:hypothetical protein
MDSVRQRCNNMFIMELLRNCPMLESSCKCFPRPAALQECFSNKYLMLSIKSTLITLLSVPNRRSAGVFSAWDSHPYPQERLERCAISSLG